MNVNRFVITGSKSLAFILGVTLLPLALAWSSIVENTAKETPEITRIVTMDRWIDLNWSFKGTSPYGFAVAASKNGKNFIIQEKVEPEILSASVFVTEQFRKDIGSAGKMYFRVAALDGSGKPVKWSEIVSVRPAQPHDIEAEIRGKFGYWNDLLPYNVNDPAYTVVYSDEQKLQQRTNARNMFAELQKAATNPAGLREFTIPPGIYRVAPGLFLIDSVSDFTIRAPGVEVIVDSEKRGAAFTFVKCTNVTLTGKAREADGGIKKSETTVLTVDSEQLPMSLSRILACDPKEKTIDVEVLPGYEINIPDRERMLVYNIQGQMLNVRQMGWEKVTPLEGRKLRLNSNSMGQPQNLNVLVPGNLLALHHLGAGGNEVCVSRGCRDMTFEYIRMVDGGGQPFDHGTAGRTVYRDWRLITRPGTNRLPIAAGLGQFSKNGGTFLFEDCEFGPHLDDGINLLSGMTIVGKVENEKQMVITGGQQPTIGSTLTFYDFTSWVKFGEAKVLAVENVREPEILTAVNAFAASNRIVQNAKRAFRTILDREVPVKPFAMVIHSDYRADSILVRGCLFRDMLAQILLLQGAKYGLIENNLLLRSTGGGVSAQFSQYWWEGPMPSNFMIRNNVIRDNPVLAAVNGFGGNGAIAVYAGTKYPNKEKLLSGFRIEGNLIINPSVYGIVIRNATNVIIRHNRIINPGACEVSGMYLEKPISELYAAICLDAVSHADVTDNEIVFDNPRCQRAILIYPNCDESTLRIENNKETSIINKPSSGLGSHKTFLMRPKKFAIFDVKKISLKKTKVILPISQDMVAG